MGDISIRGILCWVCLLFLRSHSLTKTFLCVLHSLDMWLLFLRLPSRHQYNQAIHAWRRASVMHAQITVKSSVRLLSNQNPPLQYLICNFHGPMCLILWGHWCTPPYTLSTKDPSWQSRNLSCCINGQTLIRNWIECILPVPCQRYTNNACGRLMLQGCWSDLFILDNVASTATSKQHSIHTTLSQRNTPLQSSWSLRASRSILTDYRQRFTDRSCKCTHSNSWSHPIFFTLMVG